MKPRWPKRAAPLAAAAVALSAIPLVALGSTIYFLGYTLLRFLFRRHVEV